MSLQKLITTVKLCTACIFSYLFGASGLAQITGEVADPCKTRKKHLSSEKSPYFTCCVTSQHITTRTTCPVVMQQEEFWLNTLDVGQNTFRILLLHYQFWSTLDVQNESTRYHTSFALTSSPIFVSCFLLV